MIVINLSLFFSALSVCALHPIYIHLESLTTDPKLLQEIKKEKELLNKLPQVDYEVSEKKEIKNKMNFYLPIQNFIPRVL